MKKYIPLYVISVLMLSCTNNERITNPQDYDVFLRANTTNKIAHIDAETEFWKARLKNVEDDIVSRSKLAGLLEKRFSYSGNVSELLQADSIYKLVNAIQSKMSSGTFRSLASNSIRLHKFKLAQKYIDSALALGDDKYLSLLIQFDIAIELGNRYQAKQVLEKLGNKNGFDYLIRAAKYADHTEGNLDEAIRLMEKAVKEVEKNETLWLWAKANLGDMYGHANKLRESYNCYLEVLSRDPRYYHALKGVAWLAFSGDKDPREAKRIISSLRKLHNVPDYTLLLAEIAAFENNQKERDTYIADFLKIVRDPSYGDMYNKYVFFLQSDFFDNAEQAISLATRETENRPNAEAYSWLAWAYFKQGKIDEALRITKAKVENKSFDPEVLYRMGIMYQNAGDKNKAKEYLNDAMSSAYELGPLTAKDISKALHTL